MPKLEIEKIVCLMMIFLISLILSYPSSIYSQEEILQKSDCEITNSVTLKLLDSRKILYFHVSNLCLETPKEIGRVFRLYFAANADDYSGIVLDLRDVQEGYIPAVAGITSLFLPSGATIDVLRDNIGRSIEIKTGKAFYQRDLEGEDYLSSLPDSLKVKPIAVLVNLGTQKAGDLIATALLKNKRAVLIGEEFDSGCSDKLSLSNLFYKDVIESFPIQKSMTPNTNSVHKRYLNHFYTPKGCTLEIVDAWRNEVSNAILKKVVYPKESSHNGEEGLGIAGVDLSVKGKVIKVDLISSTGSPILDQAMFQAVYDSNIKPLHCATDDSQLRVAVPIHFKLSN